MERTNVALPKVIRVGQNPEVDFPSWMCAHAIPYDRANEGDLHVCAACCDLLDAGAITLDENSGAPVLWGDAYDKAKLKAKNQEIKELTDYFTAWHVAAKVDEDVDVVGGGYEYRVEFSGLSESEAYALIKAAKNVSGVYHHVGKQHLHRYLSEFDFRYNSRHLKVGTRSLL